MNDLELTKFGEYDMRKGVPAHYIFLPQVKTTKIFRSENLKFYRCFWGVETTAGGIRKPIVNGIIVKEEDFNKVKKDDSDIENDINFLKEHILFEFPSIPENDLEECLSKFYNNCVLHDDLKEEIEYYVKFAVSSYIRHKYTEYDKNFHYGLSRDENIELVSHEVKKIMGEWKNKIRTRKVKNDKR